MFEFLIFFFLFVVLLLSTFVIVHMFRTSCRAWFTRVEYKSRQLAKFAAFSARFRRLRSLLQESRYVEEMMLIRSHNRLLFTKLQLLKNLSKMLGLVMPCAC